MDYRQTIEEARSISSASSYRAEVVGAGFWALILSELQKINSNLIELQNRFDAGVRQASNGEKSKTVKAIEARFGQSVSRVLGLIAHLCKKAGVCVD